jgi:tetratricopeptide (TPR) repeat protein
VDAATGKDLAASSASGTETQLFDLVSRAGARIRQQLGLGDVTPTQAIELEASIPSNRDAVRYYTEGIAKLRSLDAAAAVESLSKAVSSDNKHPLIHAALSEAYSALGNEAKAKEEASKAVALSGKLGPDQKLQIEADSYKAAKEWGKAVEAEKSLFESFPDNIEYGLVLANSQISAGKTKEALVTIEALRKLPARISGDGRIALVESRARQEMGDFAGQKSLAVKAAAKGRATGSRLLVAQARMLEATATFTLGDVRGATAAVDEARSLFEAAGDRSGVARALELTALSVSQQGDLEGEHKLLEQALALHRQVGDSSSVARVLSNIGKVLFLQGRTSEAQKYFDDGLSTFRQVGAKFAAAATLNNIGAMMFNRGDLPAAQKRYSQALTLFTELGDKWGTAGCLTNIAEVLECKGDLEQARGMHEESLALNRAIGEKGGSAYDLFRLGEIYSLRGELVAAHDRYQEALTIQNQIGDKLGAADSRVALAGLAIEQGHPAEAEKEAREAEEILRTEGATERSVFALGVIAQSLLAQGKQKEALDTANRAWKQAEKSEDRRVRFSVAVAVARARAASKNPSDVDAAVKFLEAETAEASRTLFVISEMETRLAMGEIEIASGRTTGKRHLAALEKDAKSKGFTAIARRAAAGST